MVKPKLNIALPTFPQLGTYENKFLRPKKFNPYLVQYELVAL